MQKRKIVSVVVSLFVICSLFHFSVQNIKADEDPDDFILWAISDSHGGTSWDDDISISGGVWSGSMIDGKIDRIDFAFDAGDVLMDGGGASSNSNYINSTLSCIVDGSMQTNFWDLPADERIWGFCMGNHEDNGGGCTEAAKGWGLDPSCSWYNNSVTMGHAYNYTVQRGNLLFIFLGGSRDFPTNYGYRLWDATDFYWLEEQVEWADNNEVNVIISTHNSIFNGSNEYGAGSLNQYRSHVEFYNVTTASWEVDTVNTIKTSGFRDPWTIEEPQTYPWNSSDSYWQLIEQYCNVNMWFNGHVHTAHDSEDPPPWEHGGWDTTLGVERDVQKSPYCTFVNCGGAQPYTDSWQFTRVCKFTTGSNDVLIRSFDHVANVYRSETGWQSSAQDITITNCLKYDYDPNWKPNHPPVVNFIFQPNVITTEDTVQFIDFSYDADGYIVNWSWDFDDGNSSYEQNPTHQFTQPGSYTVRLNVQDDNGYIVTYSTTILIKLSIEAMVDIVPDAILKKSKGRWISCYIELPEEYNVEDIDVNTILLNDTIYVESKPMKLSDYDKDGINDLMVKFDKQNLINILSKGKNVEIKITGELTDGTEFVGVDYIKIM